MNQEDRALLTDAAKHILRHALGISRGGKEYRNHFVTGPGSFDYETCLELVHMGLMRVHPASELSGGDPWFQVTDDGRAAASIGGA